MPSIARHFVDHLSGWSVVSLSDDLVELVEDEEELGEFVERLVAGAERSAMSELAEDPVADRVDRPDAQLGQVGRCSRPCLPSARCGRGARTRPSR